MQNVELRRRRRVQFGLNKREAKNALARDVFFNRLGELRNRSFKPRYPSDVAFVTTTPHIISSFLGSGALSINMKGTRSI